MSVLWDGFALLWNHFCVRTLSNSIVLGWLIAHAFAVYGYAIIFATVAFFNELLALLFGLLLGPLRAVFAVVVLASDELVETKFWWLFLVVVLLGAAIMARFSPSLAQPAKKHNPLLLWLVSVGFALVLLSTADFSHIATLKAFEHSSNETVHLADLY